MSWVGGAVESVIRVPEDSISSLETTPQYVFVRAAASHSQLSFNTRKRVELSLKTLSVFVQTDKPIYLREDKGNYESTNSIVTDLHPVLATVHLRIVVVNCLLMPNDTSKVLISKSLTDQCSFHFAVF